MISVVSADAQDGKDGFEYIPNAGTYEASVSYTECGPPDKMIPLILCP
jgi:hypothetical protein